MLSLHFYTVVKKTHTFNNYNVVCFRIAGCVYMLLSLLCDTRHVISFYGNYMPCFSMMSEVEKQGQRISNIINATNVYRTGMSAAYEFGKSRYL